ncbi:MAG: zf-TFIIB domain-containing protein [Burkholderiales bacterium]|nr:zf-TFIIB domain-containing protein [Burkholderiales bacterium]
MVLSVEEAPRRCPQCALPMLLLRLHTHGGSKVEVDHCAQCRLVWFDTLESVQLSGLGWLELLREMGRAAGHEVGHEAGRPAPRPYRLSCPVCARPLKSVHNRSRWGRFAMQECALGHGHLHSDAGLLAERGLVRPLLPPERASLRAQARVLHCLSCGAAADGRGEICAACATPLLVVDLPRLGHALRQRGADEQPLPPAEGVPLRWPCHACGQTLDPTRASACPQCGAGLLAPELAGLAPLLNAAEPELRAAANHPPRARPVRPARRTWRETQLARLWRWMRSN